MISFFWGLLSRAYNNHGMESGGSVMKNAVDHQNPFWFCKLPVNSIGGAREEHADMMVIVVNGELEYHRAICMHMMLSFLDILRIHISVCLYIYIANCHYVHIYICSCIDTGIYIYIRKVSKDLYQYLYPYLHLSPHMYYSDCYVSSGIKVLLVSMDFRKSYLAWLGCKRSCLCKCWDPSSISRV